MSKEILKVKNLSKTFKDRKLFQFSKQGIQAVNNVTLSIYEGELFALIGESGSGKSTLGKLILKMEEPTAGTITFLDQKDEPQTKRLPQDMQVIFQNPDSAMNPYMTIIDQVKEPLQNIEDKTTIAEEILQKVGISSDYFNQFPQKLSGGQKQRIVIARALVTQPKFVIADEPVSSLDVSLQAQVINLILESKRELNLTYLFISHDLRLVSQIADRVAVMYKGEIVEIGETKKIIENPQHDYTKELVAAAWA